MRGNKKEINGIKIYCNYDKIVSVSDLKPNPENPNQHPDEQIELLAKIIQSNGWRDRIVVSNLSGMIVKGHGRYQAAVLAGFGKVPVEYQDYASRDDEIKDLIADNKIAELSEIDMEQAARLIESTSAFDINTDFDLSDFGCTAEEITEYFYNEASTEHESEKYTRNIAAPIYKPTGEKPEANELFDDTRANELISEIEVAGLPDNIKQFLINAARRHTIFNYGLIAEYYAHADKKIQQLMENSGLVIIDFNRAIELGYVRLSEEVAGQYSVEYENE
jgi:hypothetical protein